MDRLNETDGSGAADASARTGVESSEAGVADAFALDPRSTLNRLRAVVYDWDIASDRLTWGPNAAETLDACLCGGGWFVHGHAAGSDFRGLRL